MGAIRWTRLKSATSGTSQKARPMSSKAWTPKMNICWLSMMGILMPRGPPSWLMTGLRTHPNRSWLETSVRPLGRVMRQFVKLTDMNRGARIGICQRSEPQPLHLEQHCQPRPGAVAVRAAPGQRVVRVPCIEADADRRGRGRRHHPDRRLAQLPRVQDHRRGRCHAQAWSSARAPLAPQCQALFPQGHRASTTMCRS